MKPEELMIGDWVCYSKANKYYTRVNEIRHTEAPLDDQWYIEGMRSDNDKINPNALEYFAVEMLSPVPLTPEILKKNGFEYYDNPVKVLMTNTINGHYVEIRLDRKEIAIWYDYDKNNDSVYSDCLFPLPYWLHDFQHALRLCGINKEITIKSYDDDENEE